MAEIRAFKAIRPVRDKVHLIASRSYVFYSKNDLREKLKGNPYTFLHIINPESDPERKSKPDSVEFLEKIKGKYLEFREKGYFKKESKDCLYIYEQCNGENSYLGIIGCASIDDYNNGVIKKHEATLDKREKKLKKYLDVVDINAEPVCFTYPDNKGIEELIREYKGQRPEYEFSTTDRIKHRLWIVEKDADLEIIRKQFKDIPSIYIADGHHRTASSARFGEDRRKKMGDYSGDEPFNYFMGFFIPESQLTIYGFNRLIKDLNGLSKEAFLGKLLKDFELEQIDSAFRVPEEKNRINLYFGNDEWYQLQPKNHLLNVESEVEKLDAQIVSKYILDPLLDIKDLRRDARVKFTGGSNGIEEMEKMVDQGKFEFGIGLHPISTAEVKAVADAGEVMPPKTTWIEPKLRSGLTIYSLSEK